mgnify:CR=1 FL=1
MKHTLWAFAVRFPDLSIVLALSAAACLGVALALAGV